MLVRHLPKKLREIINQKCWLLGSPVGEFPYSVAPKKQPSCGWKEWGGLVYEWSSRRFISWGWGLGLPWFRNDRNVSRQTLANNDKRVVKSQGESFTLFSNFSQGKSGKSPPFFPGEYDFLKTPTFPRPLREGEERRAQRRKVRFQCLQSLGWQT